MENSKGLGNKMYPKSLIKHQKILLGGGGGIIVHDMLIR